MDISIAKASLEHLPDCLEALLNSELGRTYYPKREPAEIMFKGGIKEEQIYVALSSKDECLGFIYFVPNGAFNKHPYIRCIAEKKNGAAMALAKNY